MRIQFFICCLFLFLVGKSQNNPLKLPEFLPPSPDAGAIIKGAELSSNPHTGTANVSVPIYTLKIKDFSLPISLNYSTNGFKPDEICSRVGIGWNLNAGGVITRIIRGKPDEFDIPSTQPMDPSDFTNPAKYDQLWTYLNQLSDPGFPDDSQPDEFRFNAGSLSGKFFRLRDGSIMTMPYENLKVSIGINGALHTIDAIVIIDEKGIKYEFGQFNVIEKTKTHSSNSGYLNKQVLATSWFLTQILLPTGDWIKFNYNPVEIHNITGYYEAKKMGLLPPYEICPNSNCDVRGRILVYNEFSQVTYDSHFLSSIETSNDEKAYFFYEPRPDNSGDKRLIGINIENGYASSYVNKTIKSFSLHYINQFYSPAQINCRYFLQDVTEENVELNAEQHKYIFEYNDPLHAPDRFSTTDHVGFSNKMGLPSKDTYEQSLANDADFATEINKKAPNGDAAQKGILKKVSYPTGGSDEFVYEPNLATHWGYVPKVYYNTVHLGGVGNGASITYTASFSAAKGQLIKEFHYNTEYRGVGNTPGAADSKVAFVRLIRISDGAAIQVWTLYDFSGFGGRADPNINTPVSIQAGVNYKLELEVRNGSNNFASVDIIYDAGVGDDWKEINEELCGVRVKKIVSFDPVSNKTNTKYYHYRSLNDTTQPSAQKLYYLNYITYVQFQQSGNPTPNTNCSATCLSKIFSYNSTATVEVNTAAAVTYTYVIESDDENCENGGIEYTYNTLGGTIGSNVLGFTDNMLIQNPNNYFNGKIANTRYFNNNRQTLKYITNNYILDTRTYSKQEKNYSVRKNYDLTGGGAITYPIIKQHFDRFDVLGYDLSTVFDHLNYTETTDYDLVNNTIATSRTTYAYNPGSTTLNNIHPSEISTTGSDNKVKKVVTKYPTDYPSTLPYSTMISKNILSVPVEETVTKDNKLIAATKTDYLEKTNGNFTFFVPSKVQMQANGPLEDRIRYFSYDNAGNPLELSKEKDVRMAYIWDYNNSLPVAELTLPRMLVNGSYDAPYTDQYAYTSFEAENKGGWVFGGAPQNDPNAVSGFKDYVLSSGNTISFNKQLLPNNLYTLTFWAKNGNVSIAPSYSGDAITTKNGWTLYKYVIPGTTTFSIELSGTATIDELRFHPSNALIKTYTYLPGVGVRTIANNNNDFIKYEYDEYNRLIRIRDWDNNIVKQMEYKYLENIYPCPNITPDWQNTGVTRCAKNNEVNNANTGIEEWEERDLNNCSPSYLTTRWVSHGVSANCPVETCNLPHHRLISGNCVTGTRVYIRSKFLGNLQWRCIYQYKYPDGYNEPEYEEFTNEPCVIQ